MPAAGHDDCHPQEVLSLALLGRLREIQLHGEAMRQRASWDGERSLGICTVLGRARLLEEREAWTGSACPSQTSFQSGGALSFSPGMVTPGVQAL